MIGVAAAAAAATAVTERCAKILLLFFFIITATLLLLKLLLFLALTLLFTCPCDRAMKSLKLHSHHIRAAQYICVCAFMYA